MDNSELIRAGYDAWNRQDVPALLELLRPDVVFALTGVFPGIETEYKGHDGVAQFMETLTEPWEEFVILVLQLREAGDDRVVAHVNFRGRGRDGITVERDFGHRFTICDGQLAELRAYLTWEEALAAAGIAEGG